MEEEKNKEAEENKETGEKAGKTGTKKKKSGASPEKTDKSLKPKAAKPAGRNSAKRKKSATASKRNPVKKTKQPEAGVLTAEFPQETDKPGILDIPSMGQGEVEPSEIQVVNEEAGFEKTTTTKPVEEIFEPETASIAAPTLPVNLENYTVVETVRNAPLPFAAIKVRNVVGKVTNLVAEVIPNKVIVQGVVDEQLYFVGTDGIVHHLADQVHFSTFLDIPGAGPGMNTHVTALIEKIIPELAPDGLSVVKKIILEVFVKVTETVQVNFSSGNGPLLLLSQVVTENTGQILLENDFTLDTAAVKVDEIVGNVRDIEVEVIPDKVIIQGILHKQIFFVDSGNLGRHQSEDVPFSLFVDAPGALPGMDVQVHPRIEALFFNLITPTVLRQKAVLEFFVKITERVRHNVTVGAGPLFRVEEFIGENIVQELSESVLTLPLAAVKVREIIARLVDITTHVIPDKVIVQGTIHKQIFFIGVDNVEHHQAEDISFSLFLDIPGAIPGDNIRITPIIEAVFFELITPTELRQKVVFSIQAVIGREIQLNLVLGIGPLFKTEQVVGENTKQLLLVRKEKIVPPPPTPPPPPPVIPITVTEAAIVFPEPVSGAQQIILRNQVKLPVNAIKIKDIQSRTTDVVTRALADEALVEGFVEKTVSFVGTDNIVRSLTERVPFSILVNVPGLIQGRQAEATTEIENISFVLNPEGNLLTEVIVLRGVVTGLIQPGNPVTAVTDVSGPGIVRSRVRVRVFVLLPDGRAELEELDVVIDVSGPGIIGTEKQTLLLDVIGDNNPNPVPVKVVTRVILK
jgi:hypothetical protein